MPELTPKRSGFVVTPEPIARELVRWAVRRTDDTVLDLGAGEGVFLVEAGRRLQELGVGGDRLAAAICGVEKDPARYGQTVSTLHQHFGVSFPGIRHADLFDCEFPQQQLRASGRQVCPRSGLYLQSKWRLRIPRRYSFPPREKTGRSRIAFEG